MASVSGRLRSAAALSRVSTWQGLHGSMFEVSPRVDRGVHETAAEMLALAKRNMALVCSGERPHNFLIIQRVKEIVDGRNN